MSRADRHKTGYALPNVDNIGRADMMAKLVLARIAPQETI
jgi:hypothetical protein